MIPGDTFPKDKVFISNKCEISCSGFTFDRPELRYQGSSPGSKGSINFGQTEKTCDPHLVYAFNTYILARTSW